MKQQSRGRSERLDRTQELEALGLLAGSVAHEFNNLLATIGGLTELLLEDIESPGGASAQDLREIRRATERGIDLTRQLLMLSSRGGRRPREIDLNATVRELERMLRRLLGENVDLLTDVPSTPAPIRADPTQIHQVVMNLALNARDAMSGGGTLSLRTRIVGELPSVVADERAVELGSFVCLTVADTGEGMDESVQARAFEPFFSTKPHADGTGLGLAVVYGIVQQCGGHISVRSLRGQGTAFELHFLLVQPAADAASTTSTESGPNVGGTRTILVVEDEEDVGILVRRMLVRAGYRVLAALNAGEAILACEQHEGPIDLMISDVIMPKMNGPALAARVAKMRPETKLLYMSGYPGRALGEEGAPGARAGITPSHRGRRGARLTRRESESYPGYVEDEQRRQTGWIGGRMQELFLRGPLARTSPASRSRSRRRPC